MILIRGNGGEFGFGEDERLKVLCMRHVLRLWVDVDGVEARLIFVHRVENYL